MAGIDINRFRFNYDLTIAFLLMNPDGTVYHRLGTRDYREATTWLSMDVLVQTMKQTLSDHRTYRENPDPPKKLPKKTAEDLESPLWDQPKDCIHCHQVHAAMVDDARSRNDFSRADYWVWPVPARLGLTLDPQDQSRVTEVSGAGRKAGLKPGDRLIAANGQRLFTVDDLSWVLHNLPESPTELTITVDRNGVEKTVTVKLERGWKEETPLEYSWRTYMWALSPAPGFGGPLLTEAERRKQDIRQEWAFRIGYIVNWGKNRHRGQNAAKAGLKKGDVVLSVGGKSDFESVAHFHAWFRLTQTVGNRLEIRILRNGTPKTLTLTVVK
jgi:hypothetical protein